MYCIVFVVLSCKSSIHFHPCTCNPGYSPVGSQEPLILKCSQVAGQGYIVCPGDKVGKYRLVFNLFFFLFQIYDPNNKRYEVPIQTPKVDTQATTLDYDVNVNTFPFGISVKRKSTGTIM